MAERFKLHLVETKDVGKECLVCGQPGKPHPSVDYLGRPSGFIGDVRARFPGWKSQDTKGPVNLCSPECIGIVVAAQGDVTRGDREYTQAMVNARREFVAKHL